MDMVSHLHRPPTLRYRTLIAELLRANQAFESGDDDLYVILKCLVSVLHFIDGDLVVRAAGLTRPLGMLAAALRDLGQGARPPLFFARRIKRVGRPKDTSFEAARGAAAAALAALIDWGERRQAAAKFVTEELRRAGVKAPGGKAIQPGQVLRWRDEMGGRASALANHTYRRLRAEYACAPSEIGADARRRRDMVSGAIQAIRSMGF